MLLADYVIPIFMTVTRKLHVPSACSRTTATNFSIGRVSLTGFNVPFLAISWRLMSRSRPMPRQPEDAVMREYRSDIDLLSAVTCRVIPDRTPRRLEICSRGTSRFSRVSKRLALARSLSSFFLSYILTSRVLHLTAYTSPRTYNTW